MVLNLVPAGTGNRCVMLRRGYLEFLSPTVETPMADQLLYFKGDFSTVDSNRHATDTATGAVLHRVSGMLGTYTGVVANATATVTVTVTCTNTTPYNIGLDAGLTSGATVLTRKLVGPGGALS